MALLGRLVLLALIIPAGAFAQGAGGGGSGAGNASVAETVEALAAEAQGHYDAGRHEQAVASYLRAYRVAPAAGLLYNIAYIYDRKLGEFELALNFYRRYVRAPDAEPDVVARATTRIQVLKGKIAAARAATTVPPAPRRHPEPAEPEPAPPAEIRPMRPAPSVLLAPPAPLQYRPLTRTSTLDPKRTWGWVTLGVGGLMLATGGTFAILASGTHDDFDRSTEPGAKRELRDRGRTQALVADILMGSGTLAALTGLVLVLISDDGTEPTGAALRFGPALGPAGGGLYLGGRL